MCIRDSLEILPDLSDPAEKLVALTADFQFDGFREAAAGRLAAEIRFHHLLAQMILDVYKRQTSN